MKIVNPLSIQGRLAKYKDRLTLDQIADLLTSSNNRQFKRKLNLILNIKTRFG